MKKTALLLMMGGVFLVLILIGLQTYANNPNLIPAAGPSQVNPLTGTPAQFRPQQNTVVIAQNLQIPWEIAFLPDDGGMLVTERPGRLVLIKDDVKTSLNITGVKHIGEGGLLGLALHPDFRSNRQIYLYHTAQNQSRITNQVVRYEFANSTLTNRRIILSGIPGSANHNGGRISFGPDSYLYITTGDAENPDLAQDPNSLAGKILRIGDDGSIPPDNPFGNAVYSLGHRNPQGLAWDNRSNLWATEHGPSGFQTGNDEINLVQKGGNYGWPVIKGSQTKADMMAPVIESGTTQTWAPAGIVFWNGSLYFAGLRGESLYRTPVEGNRLANPQRHFHREFGRIRAVVIGPDGFLYLTTGNTDGRAKAGAGDDKIIKINPGQI